MLDGVVQNAVIPDGLLAPMRECSTSSAAEQWRDRLSEDGYVLIRSALDPELVRAARGEVFERLGEVDEIKSPYAEGIATGRSRRLELHPDLGPFWKSVSEGGALRAVSHGARLREIMDAVLQQPSRGHDLLYLRPAPTGCSTRMHYDYPFFAGRSARIHTCWIPLGDTPVLDGPLLVVENSHRFEDLIAPLTSIDYASDHSNKVVQEAAYNRQNEMGPIELAQQRGVRLLSADFRAGDLVVFSGLLMHGSLENCSAIDRVRLSLDVRYQPAEDPCDDPRYFGENPSGSKGGGYGDMRGARPLTERW